MQSSCFQVFLSSYKVKEPSLKYSVDVAAGTGKKGGEKEVLQFYDINVVIKL